MKPALKTQVLSALLIAGLLTPLAFAQAIDPTDFAALQTQAWDLLRRAEFPGWPGSERGRPTEREVRDFECAMERARSEIVADLGNKNSGKQVGDYFDILATLAQVKLSLGKRDVADSLQRLGLPLSSGLPQFPVNSGVVETGGTVSFSREFIAGLELQMLANHPDEEHFLTLLKYLLIHHTLANLVHLEMLSAKPIEYPDIPQALREKLRSLPPMENQLAELEMQDKSESERIPSLLLSSEDQALAQLPALTDTEFGEQLASILARTSHERRFLPASLPEALVDAENSQKRSALENLLQFSFFPATPELLQRNPGAVRHLLAQASAQGVSEKLEEVLSQLQASADQRQAVGKLFNQKFRTYEANLPSKLIEGWIAAATKRAAELRESEKETRVRSIYANALRIARLGNRPPRANEFDLSALGQALLPKLQELNPPSFISEIYQQIFAQPSYIDARTHFGKIMTDPTDGDTVADDGTIYPFNSKSGPQPIPARADGSAFIRQGTGELPLDILSSLFYGVPKDDRTAKTHASAEAFKAQDQTDQMLRALDAKARADLVALGNWMGFFRSDSRIPLELWFGPGNEKTEKIYFAAVKNRLLDEQPILNAKILVPQAYVRAGFREVPLYQVLDDLARKSGRKGLRIDEIEGVIQGAIDSIVASAGNEIERIGKARSMRELVLALNSQLIQDSLAQTFPEFMDQRSNAAETLQKSSLTKRMLNGPGLAFITGTIGVQSLLELSRLLKGRLVWLDFARSALSPILDGYITSAALVGSAFTAYQFSDALEKARNAELADALFVSGGDRPGIFSIDQALETESEFRVSGALALGMAAGDAAYWFLPTIATPLGKITPARKVLNDTRAFLRLGLKPGDWAGVTRLSRSVLTATDGKKRALKALAWRQLREDLQNGVTWPTSLLRRRK